MGMNPESASSTEEVQMVTFTLGQESYGLDIMKVQESAECPAICSGCIQPEGKCDPGY